MSEQEIEEQVKGSDVDNSTLDDDTGEDNGTPENSSKNKSNFKKLSQKLKETESRAEKAERLAQEKQEIVEAWESQNPDLISKKYQKSDGIDKGDLALFLVQNPDAKNHLDDVKEYMSDMKTPDLDKAWKYVKPTIQKESETHVDFSIKSNGVSTKKDLSKMTMEEAYVPGFLSKEQRMKWVELHPNG